MKKLETIRKEEMKLRKFISKNIGLYNKDPTKTYGERNNDDRQK